MNIEEVIKKCSVGISPLTGKLYIFFPYSDGSARYKKAITESEEETINLLRGWLKSLGEGASGE